MAQIRQGDMVEVVAGDDRGKRGRVLRVIPKKNRIVVQGINLRWKHMRKSQKSPQGGRVRREVPLQISNVMLFDEAAGIRSRLGSAMKDGKKVRFGRRTGQPAGAAAAEKPAKAAKAAKPAKTAKVKKKAAKKAADKEA